MSLPEYVFGIDEAGRGPVIGPMVFGLAYCATRYMTDGTLKKLGIDDSKKLTPQKREKLVSTMNKIPDFGYIVKVIPAKEIDKKMLGLEPMTLNEISFEAIGWLISEFFKTTRGRIKVVKGYFDAIGSKDTRYRYFLETKVPELKHLIGPNLVIEPKGDALFPVVGAASIAAKVTRDRIVESIQTDCDMGSGYPADPKTSNFLKTSSDPFFCYPDYVRFSWETIKRMKNFKKCYWRYDRKFVMPTTEKERASEYSKHHLAHITSF